MLPCNAATGVIVIYCIFLMPFIMASIMLFFLGWIKEYFADRFNFSDGFSDATFSDGVR